NRLGQPGLWPHAISGDLPIVLVRIGAESELELAREVVQAHAYWRGCGLVADLVLLNDAGADDDLRPRLEDLVRNAPTAALADRPGGRSLRDVARTPADDATLLEAASRVVLRGSDGELAAQLAPKTGAAAPATPVLAPGAPAASPAGGAQPAAPEALRFG